MIKKVWAKFNGMDLECICDEHHRKCQPHDAACKEYVVKFIEVDRSIEDDLNAHLSKETSHLRREIKKFQSEISKSIRKYKI